MRTVEAEWDDIKVRLKLEGRLIEDVANLPERSVASLLLASRRRFKEYGENPLVQGLLRFLTTNLKDASPDDVLSWLIEYTERADEKAFLVLLRDGRRYIGTLVPSYVIEGRWGVQEWIGLHHQTNEEKEERSRTEIDGRWITLERLSLDKFWQVSDAHESITRQILWRNGDRSFVVHMGQGQLCAAHEDQIKAIMPEGWEPEGYVPVVAIERWLSQRNQVLGKAGRIWNEDESLQEQLLFWEDYRQQQLDSWQQQHPRPPLAEWYL